ncbi:hypothetical protein CEC48_17330 [Pseudomonas sp. K2I15]|nr:hypothetical protein CEC48_17330 [Pseudomonas sp. K2I15]
MWRGSLLPLGCAADPNFGSASHSSGSKLPRHRTLPGHKPRLCLKPQARTPESPPHLEPRLPRPFPARQAQPHPVRTPAC